MARFPYLVSVLFLVATVSSAAELHVPAQYATIQAAVAASVPGDVVIVGPGTYREAIDLMSRRITVRSSAGAKETILDGATLDHAMITADGGESRATVLQGFTFRNGKASVRTACGWRNARLGGAIFVLNAGLTITDSIFENNGRVDASGDRITAGGAVYGCLSDLTIVNSRFEDNTADHGGAVSFDGARTADLKIEQSQFTRNEAAFGGAIDMALGNNAAAAITDVTLRENDASHGGAVFADILGAAVLRLARAELEDNAASHGGALRMALSSSARAIVEDSNFRRNTASFGGGASMDATGDSIVDVARCDFAGNEASFGGGLVAIAHGHLPLDPGGTIRITASRLLDNRAFPRPDTGIFKDSCFSDGRVPLGSGLFYGGGADLRTSGGGTVSLTNSIVAGNAAMRAAGVAASSCAGGTIVVANCTIVDGDGDGVHVRLGRTTDAGSPGIAAIRVTNSIVRGNTGRAVVVEQEEARATMAVTFSNIEHGFGGEGNIDAAPLFVDRASRDYRLAEGSAGIDAGDNGGIGDAVVTDIAGKPRIADDPRTRNTGNGTGAIVDMGAYELVPPDGRRRTVRPPS
jgi:hypothetical protein